MATPLPATDLRRIDGQLVEAMQYTGAKADELRAWAAGHRVEGASPEGVTLNREHPPERVEAAAGDWVINDGERVYAIRPYDFRSHCRSVPIE